jgi:hypothetical protein
MTASKSATWTAEETAKLGELYRSGVKITRLCRAFPRHSVRAVETKLYRCFQSRRRRQPDEVESLVRSAHAAGLTDRQIATRIGHCLEWVKVIRRRLDLPPNRPPRSEETIQSGVRTLRLRVMLEGWPAGCLRVTAGVLDVIHSLPPGPVTRSQILQRYPRNRSQLHRGLVCAIENGWLIKIEPGVYLMPAKVRKDRDIALANRMEESK